jgi:hypothetical protein
MALLACFVLSQQAFGARAILEEDYNQWKQALGTNRATDVENITGRPGFKVELIRSAQTNEGSWVAMAFDPKGRVVIAREDRGLLRMTLAANRDSVTRVETVNTNLLECRGLLFAYDALYANANNSKALVRLRDTDGDDQFDDLKVLRHTPGGVGHGRNQLALGPDGFIYSIHGDDVGLPTNGVSVGSPLRHYAEDRLLPCAWDKHLFNASASMPYGHSHGPRRRNVGSDGGRAPQPLRHRLQHGGRSLHLRRGHGVGRGPVLVSPDARAASGAGR